MKAISDYTILCTEEQTKKAIELGAFIREVLNYEHKTVYEDVTAEQMIGWLESKENIKFFAISNFGFDVHTSTELLAERNLNSREEATLAAIDAALDYIYNNKK